MPKRPPWPPSPRMRQRRRAAPPSRWTRHRSSWERPSSTAARWWSTPVSPRRRCPSTTRQRSAAQIAGQTKDGAEQELASIGRTTVTLWPFWVDRVPRLEWRINVDIQPVESPAPVRIMALDHGSRRIGLAIGDLETGLAFARPALQRTNLAADLDADPTHGRGRGRQHVDRGPAAQHGRLGGRAGCGGPCLRFATRREWAGRRVPGRTADELAGRGAAWAAPWVASDAPGSWTPRPPA